MIHASLADFNGNIIAYVFAFFDFGDKSYVFRDKMHFWDKTYVFGDKSHFCKRSYYVFRITKSFR